MAVDFKTPHQRSSEYMFLPEDIQIRPDFNGRHEAPDIEWLITSLIKKGQTTPILIGNDGGEPWLKAGHSRWRAAIEINKRKLTPNPFKLRCVYHKGDDLQSFLATISENHDRTPTSAIDDAYNIATLERYNMTLEEIARDVYRQEVKWVKDRLALIELCKEGQTAVMAGTIKPNAAVVLAKLSKVAQKERIASGVPLTAASIRKSTAPAVTVPRIGKANLADVKTIIAQYVEDGSLPEGVSVDGLRTRDALHVVLSAILDRINGVKADSKAAA